MLRHRRNRLQDNEERCKPHRKTLQRRQRLEEVEAAEATEVVGARREIAAKEVADALVLRKVS